MTFRRPDKASAGFTLIELLVVISIIALLSSVILAALSTARNKGKDASVQESAIQMRNFYEIQYSTNNSYSTLLPSGMGSGGTSISPTFVAGSYNCTVNATNNYCTVLGSPGCTTLYGAGTQGEGICKDVFNKSGVFSFGLIDSTSLATPVSNYAFALAYPSNLTQFFCIRSSGGNKIVSSINTCLDKTQW